MLKWKWGFIVGVTAFAVFCYLRWGLKLGLDLKGGIHLVVRVETDDAIRTELDEAVTRLRLQFESKGIAVGSVERRLDSAANRYEVVVAGVPPEGGDRARKALEATLAGWRFEYRESELVAALPLAQVEGIRTTTIDQAKTTIDERVNATGVAEPLVQTQGSDRIVVELPGVEDPEHVKRLIGQVAFLELKLVSSGPHKSREDALAGQQGALPAGLELIEGSDDEGGIAYWVVERFPIVTGRDLAGASPDRDEFNQPTVAFSLNSAGAQKFGEGTGKNIGKRLAIILDQRVKSAPVIESRITDRGQIRGGFTREEARDLALVLRAGALPAKIRYLEERTVGPSLGKDSIDRGVLASLVGLAGIVVMMVGYYRLSGVNAVIAVVLNGVLLLGALAWLGARLTLPGIAGFILTLGMAVDANVLIFEAIRESLRNGVTPKRAVEEGFDLAFTTILDSNLTTLFAAGALLLLGEGPVRGFGVTLFIGLIISMFTSYFVSKTIFQTFVLRRDWKPGDALSI